jgi:hypothetical protein
LAVSERVDLRSALASAIAAGQRTYGGRRPRRERGRWVVSIGIAAWARTQMQVSLPESRAPLSCATTQIQAVPVLVFCCVRRRPSRPLEQNAVKGVFEWSRRPAAAERYCMTASYDVVRPPMRLPLLTALLSLCACPGPCLSSCIATPTIIGPLTGWGGALVCVQNGRASFPWHETCGRVAGGATASWASRLSKLLVEKKCYHPASSA